MFPAIAIGLVALQCQAMVATSEILPNSNPSDSGVMPMGDVFEVPEIDPYRCHGACAALHLYDRNDVLLHTVHGTNARMRVTGVAKVQSVGHYGCYTIFKLRDFRSTNLCWTHMDRLNIMEAEYGYSVVRYVLVQNI